MSKELARNRRAKKLRAQLQKRGFLRITILRTNNHISAQLIDSSNGNVLSTVSTLQKALKMKSGGNMDAAKVIGTEIAKRSIELGHKKVAFDRSGYRYHGRVKALAEGAREGGLEF